LLSAMVSRANAARAGLLFVHSHPDPRHPTALSLVDRIALDGLAASLPGLIDGPFAAAVSGPRGWVAELYDAGRWNPVDRITVAGPSLRILDPHAPTGETSNLDARQAQALGAIHRDVLRLDAAIIGSGGLGCPLAEAVYRMGPRRLLLADNG